MVYYARSENAAGERETVSHHLKRCADLTAEFAADFGCQKEGELMGLFHDAGKYSALFQDVLNKKECHVNHEAAGACLLKHYIKQFCNTALPLTIAIYGHHKGLEYGIDSYLRNSMSDEFSEDKLGRRFAICGKNQYSECVSILKSENNLPKHIFKAPDYSYCKNHKLAEMLYIRMLLSCLADGDYSSSAEHFDEDYLKQATDMPLDSKKLLKSLMDYKAKICQGSTANKSVNEIRNTVFNDCLS